MSDPVIVGGVRTPFAKAAGRFNRMSAQELGRIAVRELLERHDLTPDCVDQVITGNVASPVEAPNVARVIALRSGVPKERPAHTVSRNCASGMESVTQAVEL
ncbi:MAG: acetyl-CoA C-acyltransferase, partial [Planctomycetales bacterium]